MLNSLEKSSCFASGSETKFLFFGVLAFWLFLAFVFKGRNYGNDMMYWGAATAAAATFKPQFSQIFLKLFKAKTYPHTHKQTCVRVTLAF